MYREDAKETEKNEVMSHQHGCHVRNVDTTSFLVSDHLDPQHYPEVSDRSYLMFFLHCILKNVSSSVRCMSICWTLACYINLFPTSRAPRHSRPRP